MKKKTKKHAQTTMAAAIAVGSIVAVAPMATQASTQFSDVKVTDYYYEDVLQLAERGVVSGFSDGTFKPKQDVTRGQAAKIIAGVLGLDTTNVSNPGFKDVPTSHQYYGAIAALANAGIINGYEDGTFRPGTAVQRNHMAKIIAGAFNLNAPADFKTPLTDVRADYAPYVTALYSAGVTTGKTATTYEGSSNVTRGQLASFVVRAEKATDAVAKDVTFTISKVDGDKVNGYTISTTLKGLLTEANNAALEGAVVNAKLVGDEIVGINSLQLNAAGTEGALVTLDGGNSTIAGDLVVNADFVEVKNVTVQGNVSLTNSVMSEFSADALINTGEFLVEDANGPVASITPIFANTTNGLKIDFKNSDLNSVHVKRDNVALASNVKLPEVTVSAKVSAIQIDADVAKLKVDVTVNIAISGAGSFDEVTLQNAVEVALNIIGNIAKLVVNNADARVEIAASIKIGDVILPANSTAAGIIKNYESIKGNIGNVVIGDTPSTPGSGGAGSSNGGSGSGSGGSGVETPVTVSDVTAIIGSDGKTITVTAKVKNSKATKATIEFYQVENNVVASTPLTEYTRQADIKDGKVDFWTKELPAGTYQVKVTVDGKSNVSSFVTVLSGNQTTPTATEKQQEALAGFTLTELADTVTTDSTAKLVVEEQVAAALAGVTGNYSVAISEFEAAVDGTETTPAGTKGSFKVTITLDDNTTTVVVTGSIAAKAYEAGEEEKTATEKQQEALVGFTLTELADTVTTDSTAKLVVEEQVAAALAGVTGNYSVAISEF
ncbi:S-layer homology domain-containing protein, partial [Solibacillus sp. CAU 1738]|uniref:S-layer homology domain-containing protein n=1 Tax=Solibacillus sp. CAU 1738 TaxID=3140363 RepID=UPI003260FADC